MELGGTADGGADEGVSRGGVRPGEAGSEVQPVIERPAPLRDQAQRRRAEKTTTRPRLARPTPTVGTVDSPAGGSVHSFTPSAATHAMQRRSSPDAALRDLEAGAVSGVTRVVVSRGWWDALSEGERHGYQRRAAALGVALSADERISRHFVELVDDADAGGTPPLSSERRV